MISALQSGRGRALHSFDWLKTHALESAWMQPATAPYEDSRACAAVQSGTPKTRQDSKRYSPVRNQGGSNSTAGPFKLLARILLNFSSKTGCLNHACRKEADDPGP